MRLSATRWMVATAMVVAVAGCTRDEPAATETGTETAAQSSVQRDDNWIATSVKAKYYTDDEVRGRNIMVDADAGVVTLRGTVESEQARNQAVALAQGVEGVSSVNDELRVETAAATPATDPAMPPDTRPVAPRDDTVGTAGRDLELQPAWITTKIQAKYFVNPEIKPLNIDVTTNSGGIVVLEGEVEDADDKTEAVRVARETEGVTRVEDRLRVKADAAGIGESRPADAPGTVGLIDQPDPWVTAKIQAKYFVDDDVKGRHINVNTNEGVVTLSGTVADEAERRQALALARNTDGVREVTDQLNVDPSADRDRYGAAGPTVGEAERTVGRADAEMKRPDAWITTKIQSKYFLDADVKGHQINVDTNDGVVTLKGTVANEQHKAEAAEIARDTEGVTRVVNQLTVGGAEGERR
jgi:hyperosmotically inducible protein